MTTLYLAWQHAPTRRWFPVGRLIRRPTETEEFEFSYVQGAREAQDVAGFRGIPEFPDLYRRYEATDLFPTFRNRAMNKGRRDRAAHLHELGLDVGECDEVAELLASGGRSHTDSFETFPGIEPDTTGRFHTRVMLHGLRHANEHVIEAVQRLRVGDKLRVAPELNIPVTSHGLVVYTQKRDLLGWLPRYIAEAIQPSGELTNLEADVTVARVNQHAPLSQRLLVDFSGRLPPGVNPMGDLPQYQPIDVVAPKDAEATAVYIGRGRLLGPDDEAGDGRLPSLRETMPDARLIERWLPIAALGEESVRERRAMTALPPIYYLHVWWARRPLVASRAAVLASLLPADADRTRFLHMLGIHGNPVETRRRIDAAKRNKENLGRNPYGYKRAFTYLPSKDDKEWADQASGGSLKPVAVLDPTAGGGSIPFEAGRLGCTAVANDLNPVAGLILKATTDWPARHGAALLGAFRDVAYEFIRKAEPKYEDVFPEEPEGVRIEGYLWARTVACPYCDGSVPLSPNWRLASDGIGVRLKPQIGAGPGTSGRICSFEIVATAREQSPGTVARGDGTCPYSDCERVIAGENIKAQAQAGAMGEQLFAVVYKERVLTKTSTGRSREKWVRRYRAPCPEDDNSADVEVKLAEKLPEWDVEDIVPSERIPDGNKTAEPLRYGMAVWRDLFSPRQLLCHGTSVEVFREMLETDRLEGKLNEIRQAAYGYLALSIDKLLDRNSLNCTWDSTTGRIGHTFQRHDLAFKWSYAEMAPLIVGLGYDWVIKQTAKCIGELVTLVRPEADGENEGLFAECNATEFTRPPISITCKPGDSLDHIEDSSIDAVVMDPPYGANVMYAELSDFFYVWLKRTAGRVFPELFRRNLTDKENEAVANAAKFRGTKGAATLAERDYQERMASIFAECRRVLKPDGIMTVMFTHKETSAWDALTKGLMEAGFIITASWPVNTEAEGSLHIKDKAAANSTIFLACRPRGHGRTDGETVYWEDVEPQVARAVRSRVGEFQEAGIAGVDLYLASFGPALEEFSRHWPLKRGTPRQKPETLRRRRQQFLFEEEWDPYAATPEDALNTARREVQRWRVSQLANLPANIDLDPTTAFFVLAWDTFKAPVFAYDEALGLSRAVGVNLDHDVVGRLAQKKGSNLRLWDSAERAAKGSLGPADGSRGMIDAVHQAAHAARNRSIATARDTLERAQVAHDSRFVAALEAVLEVLPPSKRWTSISLEGDVAAAGNDFEALYDLFRLAYSDKIDEPAQLKLWEDGDR